MPRTGDAIHPIDGWEATFGSKPELGVLRISHVPNSTLIGLFIRFDEIMFPLGYFRNWHCAHRFATWMEGTSEPEPTFAQQWKELIEAKSKQVEEAPGIQATLSNGVMTYAVSSEPQGYKTDIKWPREEEEAPVTDSAAPPQETETPKNKPAKPRKKRTKNVQSQLDLYTKSLLR